MNRAARRALTARLRPFVKDLDAKLLRLSRDDWLTLRDAVCGVHAFGGIGSGKTSATGRALAAAFLRAGMGGLVLCAKPEEVEFWRSYARAHGREESLVIFDEHAGYNFLSHALAKYGAGGIGSVIDCLMTMLDAADHASGIANNSQEQFWPLAIREVLSHVLPVIHAAKGTVTVKMILDFVTTAATKPEQYLDKDWVNKSFAGATLRQVVDAPRVPLAPDTQEAMLAYWFREYPAIPEKTRGNIVISISTKLDRFRHGRMRSCFCYKTTVLPEFSFGGSIILMAMPPMSWGNDGAIGQILMKYMWERIIESRNGLDPSLRDRPVFLWCDEAHTFLHHTDDQFLSTCRASRACVVFMSQSLPTYFSKVGEGKVNAVKGLLGKFGTHIFHLNSCNDTNKFASDIIGRDLVWRSTQGRSDGWSTQRGMNEGSNVNRGHSSSHGTSSGGKSTGFNSNSGNNTGSGENYGLNVGQGSNGSESYSQQQTMDNVIEPGFFARGLLPGGPKNGNIVTAVWFKAGAHFRASRGRNWMIARFRQ